MKITPLALVLMAALPARAAVLELVVEAPEKTDKVFVALSIGVGEKPAWAPDSFELKREGKTWRGRLEVPDGELELKLTRGSWETVEKGPRGDERGNRKVTAKGETKVEAKVATWADQLAAQKPMANKSLVDLGVLKPGKLRPRRVVVYLPPKYDDEQEKSLQYPVLYVLDGQNQFDPARSFLGVVWALDKAADAHAAAGRQPFIAVAIDNTQDRADEYLPSRDEARKAGGKLEDLATFIFSELKPEIDKRFRTRKGPDDTGILGSSFGGMAAFHLGWKHSDKVRRMGVVSPSLWWNHEETLELVKSTKTRPPVKIWLDMGTREGKDDEGARAAIDTARSVRDALEKLGFARGKDFHYMEAEGAVHNEGAWAERLPAILEFLFPKN